MIDAARPIESVWASILHDIDGVLPQAADAAAPAGKAGVDGGQGGAR